MTTSLIENMPVVAGAPDGILKLRGLILELAVRGKLVPQSPADQPARELMKQIAGEKARLAAEGGIKKQKSFSEIDDAEKGFKLPNGWEWTRLGVLFNSLISGGTPSKSNPDYWNGPIPWASVKDLNVTRDLETTQDSITAEGLASGSKLAKAGDVIICTRMGLGKIAVARRDLAINQDLKAVRISSFVDVDYFLCFYRTLRIIGSGMTVTGIKQEELLGYVIALPPLDEQHRIVAKVHELMGLCDRLEAQQGDAVSAHTQLAQALLDSLVRAVDAKDFAVSWQRLAGHFHTLFTTEASIDALKRALLQLAVTGALVPQDSRDEPASELLRRIAEEKSRLVAEKGLRTSAREYVPKDEFYVSPKNGWEHARLGNLAKFIDYRGRTPTKTTSGTPLITAKNVREGFISREPFEYIALENYRSWMTRGIPRVGDILFTTEAPLGNVAIVDIEEPFALAQRVICFQLHIPAVGPFLRLLIMSESFRKQLKDVATGMTATGIKASRLKEIPVPIPPLAEQHRIVSKLTELTALCERLKARLNQARQMHEQLANALVERALA